MILFQGELKVATTSMSSSHGFSTQGNQVEKVMEEYQDIFPLPIGVPIYCQFKHSIDLTLGMPLPNGLSILSPGK
jgi:hypothetical protein